MASAGERVADDRALERSLFACALDRRVDDPDAFGRRLSLEPLRRSAAAAVFAQTSGERLHVLRCGAIVVEDRAELDASLGARIEALTGVRVLDAFSERFAIAIDPLHPADRPRVGWDRVVVPEPSDALISAVALLLGQSVAIERYEAATTVLVGETLDFARLIAGRRLPRSTRSLVARVGTVLRDRLELAQQFYLLDRPDETWEDPRVAELHDGLFANLELGERYQAMLHKLEAVERATGTALSLWQGRRSNALEWAIVVLIVVEIGLALAGIA